MPGPGSRSRALDYALRELPKGELVIRFPYEIGIPGGRGELIINYFTIKGGFIFINSPPLFFASVSGSTQK